MTLDITIDEPRWEELGLPELAESVIAKTLDRMDLDLEDCEVSLLACNDARIAELNQEFRDKGSATNVLSWPAEELSSEEPGGQPSAPEPDFTGETVLGDIAISYETCAREADAADKTLVDHATHLLVHGTLHLLGYDHIHDSDATVMEALEVEILGKLGIDNPYIVETGP